MDGVNILNQYVNYTHSDLWSVVVILSIVFMAVFIFFDGSIFVNDGISIEVVVLLILSIIFTISTIISANKYNDSAIKIITYQVTIDDSINMNDFNDKYDIIKIEGKIYTVVEKEID